MDAIVAVIVILVTLVWAGLLRLNGVEGDLTLLGIICFAAMGYLAGALIHGRNT